VPATPSREPITAAVTAAAVLATIWMTDRPNLLSPSWSPTAVVAADPAATAVPVVAAVAGAIFWVAGSGVTRREAGERPGARREHVPQRLIGPTCSDETAQIGAARDPEPRHHGPMLTLAAGVTSRSGFRIVFVTALAALPDRPPPVATSPQP
jgi:hypothetical protein